MVAMATEDKRVRVWRTGRVAGQTTGGDGMDEGSAGLEPGTLLGEREIPKKPTSVLFAPTKAAGGSEGGGGGSGGGEGVEEGEVKHWDCHRVRQQQQWICIGLESRFWRLFGNSMSTSVSLLNSHDSLRVQRKSCIT